MNRKEFVQNSFMAALALAIASSSKMLRDITPDAPAIKICMDTSVLRHGDIIITPWSYEKGQLVHFFIDKDKDGFVAIRIDDRSVRIKIEQEPVLTIDQRYYDEEKQHPMAPMRVLDIPEIGGNNCVVVSNVFDR